MKLKIISIGKSHPSFVQDGVSFYIQKIKHLCDIQWVELISKNKHEQVDKILTLEADLFQRNIQDSDYVILLDERGRVFDSSVHFSEYLNKKQTSGIKQIIVLIGGAYGFHSSIYERANEKISMATMTFSHQNIRLVFLEQLYRGFAILRNLPYHHE